MKQTELDAFGYAETPFRIECRPTYEPCTREELVEMLDILRDCGVKAWWHSVSSKGSYPMFRSGYLPYRDDAVDYFPWLTEESHKRNISIFSWEYLCTAPILGEKKPEWREVFLDWDGPSVDRDKHHICYNSPYGNLLKDYCVEVVEELGFDGIWFDGSSLMGHGASGEFACCCGFCAMKYRKETGRNIPSTINYHDMLFREFVTWRYNDYMNYWRELSNYVKERKSDAIIAFNHFNRFAHGAESANPLLRLGEDASTPPDYQPNTPMSGMISTEMGHWPQQVPLLIKKLRAINDNFPVEIWSTGSDILTGAGLNVNPRSLIHHGQTCMTLGGYGSFGIHIKENPATLAALTKALRPIAPFVGGKQDVQVAYVLSGATKDFTEISDDGKKVDSLKTWQRVMGLDNILNALHFSSDVLLDNMLCEKFLKQYQAVILPGVQCLSDNAVSELIEYAENGGLLLLIGEVGTMTLMGASRKKRAFDDFFGIDWRDTEFSSPILSMRSSSLKGCYDEKTGLLKDGLPEKYRLSGTGKLIKTESAEVLAEGVYSTKNGARKFGASGILKPNTKEISGAAVISKNIGKGKIVNLAFDVVSPYASSGPREYTLNLIQRLLQDITPAFRTDAPANVMITNWRQNERTVFHLLNVPSSMSLLSGSSECYGIAPPLLIPEIFPPVRSIKIIKKGKWKKAYCPTNPDLLSYEITEDKVELKLEFLEQHAVVVVE